MKEKEVEIFTNGNINLPIKVNQDNSIEFDAEQAAIGLGISEVAKSGNVVVKWTRVNKYLSIDTSVDGVKRGDFITEPQFYKLAIKANNQVAEKFQDWVTGEVLPSIRKHGAYMTAETVEKTLADPENMIKILTALKNERDAKELAAKKVIKLNSEIKKAKPKVEYHDRVLKSNAKYTTTQIAKMYGISARKLNQILHDEKFIFNQNGEWLLYSKFQNENLLQSETKVNQDGYVYQSSRWTERGRKAIYILLKKRRNMLPSRTSTPCY